MALRIAETYARNPGFYGGTYCVNCGTHFDLTTPHGANVHMHNMKKSQTEVAKMYQDVEQIQWHFQWLDEKTHVWDGSYVGE